MVDSGPRIGSRGMCSFRAHLVGTLFTSASMPESEREVSWEPCGRGFDGGREPARPHACGGIQVQRARRFRWNRRKLEPTSGKFPQSERGGPFLKWGKRDNTLADIACDGFLRGGTRRQDARCDLRGWCFANVFGHDGCQARRMRGAMVSATRGCCPGRRRDRIPYKLGPQHRSRCYKVPHIVGAVLPRPLNRARGLATRTQTILGTPLHLPAGYIVDLQQVAPLPPHPPEREPPDCRDVEILGVSTGAAGNRSIGAFVEHVRQGLFQQCALHAELWVA